jgi:hypothetical protein
VSGHKRPEPPLDILEAWHQRGVPLDGVDAVARRRDSFVDSLSRTIRAEQRRRVQKRRLFVVFSTTLAFAAAAAIYVVAVRPPSRVPEARSGTELDVTLGMAVSVHAGQPVRIGPEHPVQLAEHDEVRVEEGGAARLALPRGVRVGLASATRTTLLVAAEGEQRLALQAGSLSVSVPKPGGPETFAITTPNAEVVVHGTEFTTSVDFLPDGTPRTAVVVTRGAVLVVHQGVRALVRAGSSWSSDALPSVPPASTVNGDGVGAGDTSAHLGHDGAREAALRTGEPASKSELAEQNRLFRLALDARAAHDDAAVVRHLDELLTRFSSTTLAQEARLARFRALKRLGRDREAAREARRYLSTYPDAPARDEARDVLLEAPTSR